MDGNFCSRNGAVIGGTGGLLFWCVWAAGGLAGIWSYKNCMKRVDIDMLEEGIYAGAGRWLLVRRGAVIVVGVVGAYYIWQLAKGI